MVASPWVYGVVIMGFLGNFCFLFCLCVSLSASALETIEGQKDVLSILTEDVLWLSGITNKSPLSKKIQEAKKCLQAQHSKIRQNPLCTLVTDVEQGFRETVPWNMALTSNVVYLTERHFLPDSKNFLIENLATLKKMGFTHFAMEMWNSSSQNILDAFSDAKISPEEFKTELVKNWNYLPDVYFQLMSELRKQRFIVVGLDRRDTLAPNTLQDPEQFNLRDEHMADILAQNLADDPKAKIIVYTGHLHGYAHFSDRQRSQIEKLQKKTGVRAQTFMIIDNKSTSPLRPAVLATGHTQGFVALDVLKYSIDGFFIHEKEADLKISLN